MTTPALRRLLPLTVAAALLAPPAGAAGAAPACTYTELANIPLRYTGPDLEVTLGGEIDGTPARMLVDTGAFASFLTRTGIERRGLPLRETINRVSGVGGDSRLYTAHLRDMAVGPFHTGAIDMNVIGNMGNAPPYDAIIGDTVLMAHDLEISLADKTLKLLRPSGCDETFLGDWGGDIIVVPFALSGSGIPRFTVKVNGHKMIAVIDSGAETSSISPAGARRAGLKLDGPGVKRVDDIYGVGERKVAQWVAVFDSFSIGTETIDRPELSIVDDDADTDAEQDMLLGADFLRAHHVLFAKSQKKIYLSYLGGQVFTHRTGIEPWIRQEADAGNADAQFALARMYQAGTGAGVAPDQAMADAWLDKAAVQGSPYARLDVGARLLHAGQPAQAAQQLKAALDQLPTERFGALRLHLARLQGGDPVLAKSELEATFARNEGAWPAPIANFYLGRIGADELLSLARKDGSRSRICDTHTWLAEWHEAHGDKDKAATLRAAAQTSCDRPAGKPPA
jgi:predicted aspartyl protease